MTRIGLISCLAAFALIAVPGAERAGAQIVVPDPDQPNPFVPPGQDDNEDDDEDRTRDVSRTPVPPPIKVAPAPTALLVQRIEESLEFCISAPRPYAIDCISVQFDTIAATLPVEGDYAEAREVLENASRQLRRVVRRNASDTLPRVTLAIETESGPEPLTDRPLRAVEAEDLAVAEAEATAIIDEAATILLRSGAADTVLTPHYARIAQAVESSKVLLRSS